MIALHDRFGSTSSSLSLCNIIMFISITVQIFCNISDDAFVNAQSIISINGTPTYTLQANQSNPLLLVSNGQRVSVNIIEPLSWHYFYLPLPPHHQDIGLFKDCSKASDIQLCEGLELQRVFSNEEHKISNEFIASYCEGMTVGIRNTNPHLSTSYSFTVHGEFDSQNNCIYQKPISLNQYILIIYIITGFPVLGAITMACMICFIVVSIIFTRNQISLKRATDHII